MSKRILVIGASRGVGLQCVEQALDRGWTVHAMARSEPKGIGPHPRILPVLGDCRNPTLLDEGVMGVDAVISTIAVPPSLSKVTLFSEHMAALLPAMKKANVKRLVLVTGLGAGDSRGHGGFLYDWIFFPLFLARMYADKDREEALVQASDRDWTIVRPGVLTNGRATGKTCAFVDPKSYRGGSISRADVATFLLDCIEHDRHVRETPVIVS